MSTFNGEISFKLLDKVGLIAVTPLGWHKELNIISWNGGAAKYDIRDWSPEHDRMSKGMTLREEELQGLHKLLLEKYGTKPVVYENDEIYPELDVDKIIDDFRNWATGYESDYCLIEQFGNQYVLVWNVQDSGTRNTIIKLFNSKYELAEWCKRELDARDFYEED